MRLGKNREKQTWKIIHNLRQNTQQHGQQAPRNMRPAHRQRLG